MQLLRRFVQLLLVLGTLSFVAVTAAGLLARYYWLFDLAAQLRVQLLFAGTALVGGWALLRSWRWFWLTLALLALNALSVAPFYLPQNGRAEARILRVMTVNILRDNENVDLIMDEITQAAPDVVAIQEVKPVRLRMLERLQDLYPHQFVLPQENHFGIALLSKQPLSDRRVVTLMQSDFPMLIAQTEVDGQAITLVAVHVVPPLREAGSRFRNRQLEAASATLADIEGPLVVMGDFNATPFTPALIRLQRQAEVSNAARGQGLQPTWRARRYPFGLAIDHVLVSPEWQSLNRRVGSNIGSDHYPVVVDLGWRDR